jgi:signal transduction histidine kinase/DNA-binding NarL/FixJ family response regulator
LVVHTFFKKYYYYGNKRCEPSAVPAEAKARAVKCAAGQGYEEGEKMSVRMKMFLTMAAIVLILTTACLGIDLLLTGRHLFSAEGMHCLINAMIFMLFGILASIIASGKLAGRFRGMDEHSFHIREFSGASGERGQFIANMRSDMRKPLNSVIRISEYILGEGDVRGEMRDSIEKIHNAGMTLLGIINDVMNVPTALARKFDLIPVEYDVPSLINDIVALNTIRIGGKPINFSLHVSESLPRKLFGDELRVELICNNLLDNAFKYTEKGQVDLLFECERDGNDEWLTICVIDTGIGIRPEKIEKIFSDHAGAGMSYANLGGKIDGTGLSVTKTIVEMMDGTIIANSAYNKGSVFTVRIRQGFVTDVPIGSAVAESLRRSLYYGNSEADDKKLARIQLPHVRVLVIDDVQTNLDIAKELLSAYGMRVDCVTSVKEAIDSVCKRYVTYNAIFMDHMMREMSGIEAARVIHEEIGTEYARNIPIIALTANTITENEKVFLRKDFRTFLSKPLDIIRLDEVVTELLAGEAYKKAGVVNRNDRRQEAVTPALVKSLANKIPAVSAPQSA